ncbi:MFS transporter [Luedemannella helvata]|uniref:MFS transporter n=1 Tax=Luedemannella helvata TaxID=349315 RepID=UPI0031DEB0DA
MRRPLDDRPATFREVFASRDFRYLYAASTLSWIGDALARAAATALIYRATGSVVASAAGFAISYVPWLIGAPVLVALAERYPARRTLVGCDLARMALMAMAALPGLPPAGLLIVLLAAATLTPPFEAVRSATLPRVLDGDRYVVGLALNTTTAQPAQVLGYLLGAALAAHHPRTALLLNALTFGLSALLIRTGVRWLPTVRGARRQALSTEMVAGFRLVFGTPVLRIIAITVFTAVTVVILPEGLAAPWAAEVSPGPHQGWAQGAIMISVPVGYFLGGLLFTRLTPPGVRTRMVRILAVTVPVSLIPAILAPNLATVVALGFGCGMFMGGLVPSSNGLFVQALPDGYRARAFGVVQSGIQLLQGAALLAAATLTQWLPVPLSFVVGAWSAVALVIMIGVSLRWPTPQAFADARDAANRANQPDTPTV